MNLKNSKFFKRIQELRRLSKDKIRKEKNRGVRIDFELESALKERNGDCVSSVQQKGCNGNEKLKGEKYDQSEHSEKSQNVSDGLIQLNNVCFRLKCASIPKSSQMSRDDQPNIS